MAYILYAMIQYRVPGSGTRFGYPVDVVAAKINSGHYIRVFNGGMLVLGAQRTDKHILRTKQGYLQE